MIYSLATAIHGVRNTPDVLAITTSIVEGERKERIVVRDTVHQTFDPRKQDAVKAVIDAYLVQISAVVRRQRAEVPETMPVPIVFGWPVDIDRTDLVRHIGACFRENIALAQRLYEPNVSTNAGSEALYGQQMVADCVIGHLAQQTDISFTDISFEGRGYMDQKKHLSEATRELVRASLASDHESEIRLLKSAAPYSRHAHEQLKAFVRKLASEFALIICANRNPAQHQSRFLTYGIAIDECRESEIYNCFHGDEELREIFTSIVIDILRTEHHIAIKCPRDASNPPFTDVAATYIADNLDLLKFGEIHPGSARIYSR